MALGCTEPIAIAYCSAYARDVLGKLPARYIARCSGSIIKNVRAVTVPNTNGLKGIEAATLAGAIGGDAGRNLEVLSTVTPDDIGAIRQGLEQRLVDVQLLDSDHALHIIIEVFAGDDTASVEIIDTHDGIGDVYRNGTQIRHRKTLDRQQSKAERDGLTVRDILAYADTVDLDEVREVLERQIEYNSAISARGLNESWGESVGRTLLLADSASLHSRLAAVAAAGSDARMNGCAQPVVINSGSGNQGMTASLPVIAYAREIGAGHDDLLRALCVSNLVTIHQKTDIGPLSAYCGAVSAATGAAAAIAYLDKQPYTVIADTIINSLATVSGMVCDGAKSSCAAKISCAVGSALTGYEMAKNGLVFESGEGIVKGDVEKTLRSVGRMAARGMRETDTEILNIILDN